LKFKQLIPKRKILKPERISSQTVRRLLIRATNWIGDAIMITPAVRAIRAHFPQAEISILAKPWVAPVFEHNPHMDRVMLYDGKGQHRSLMGKLRLAKELRHHRFDAVILLQNAFESALLAFLAGIPKRIGYDTDARGFLLTHPVPCTSAIRAVHQTGYYLGILRGIGGAAENQDLELVISHADQERAWEILREHGISPEDTRVGINPGATFGTAKRWFPERYAELCQRLKKSWDCQILIFGGPGEEAMGHQLREHIGDRCANFCGKTSLREAMALIQKCRLFITNDSGLMHVAAALDVPQVAIFGSTDHVTTSPRSDKSHIVKVPTLCSPCLKPDCPEGHHRCMDAVTVDMVFATISERQLLPPF